MFKKSTTALFVLLILLGATDAVAQKAAAAQDESVDRVTVELSDPGKPAFLAVGLVNGGITVTGYDGKDVVVEAQTRMKKIDQSNNGKGKSAGMTRIPVSSTSLTVEEYGNKIEIDTDSWAHPVDLTIKVPKNTSLEMSCVNQGDIRVENITGSIEVSNVNGGITLRNISGSALASSHNDDVIVTFASIDPDKDMSFSSFNGDVDVTFPASLKAKIKLKTVQGDIFTDFEVKEIKNPERVVEKNQRDTGGKYQVSVERAFWATINGGGQEIHFSNYNGDIFIRKHK